MPANYVSLLAELKERITSERLRVTFAANAAMILLYWDIGQAILHRQKREGWGAKVIDRLSVDLHKIFPDMQGLSPRNLKYMRKFAEVWPDRTIVQASLAQITWYHNLALLEKSDSRQERLWYAAQAAENGWSRNILVLQIENKLYQRRGKAVTNFKAELPPADSDMAAQVFKDPYLFDFLGTADPRREREIEQALIDHIQRFLMELGAGFAFVGRQVHLEFASADYYLDLLFYHLKLRCYVVVELKAVPFDPAFVGKLNMYLSAVDDLLRHSDDKPTIGLLLCKGKDRLIAEYALRDFRKPIGLANWETKIVSKLPKEYKGSLPSVEEIEAELSEKKTKAPIRQKSKSTKKGAAKGSKER
jgi:predicted nuclease of restriction endonuclease-like (RecB) superfamily